MLQLLNLCGLIGVCQELYTTYYSLWLKDIYLCYLVLPSKLYAVTKFDIVMNT